jgi:hypothetical protein
MVGGEFTDRFSMTDFTVPPQARKRTRSTSAGLIFALVVLLALIVGAAAFVALVLWPRWPGAATSQAPNLPVTVNGVLFNVPQAAIRVRAQRHSGAQERVDLAFLWPSLEAPDPRVRPEPAEAAPPIDRLFVTIAAQTIAMAPNDRVRSIYPRYLSDTQYDGPDGLKVVPFREGTPYQNEDLFFDPAAQPGFVVRCSRPGAAATPGTCLYERRYDSADVTVRFPSDWLTQWRALDAGIGTLLAKIKPAG